MLSKTLLLSLAIVTAGCAATPEYVFRNDDRPAYRKTITAAELRDLKARGEVTVLDVRLAEDYDANPTLIPGAAYRDPERISRWASAVPKDRPVVVYCVGGRWVSQKAAHYLAEDGYEVYSLDGGIEGWEKAEQR